jgi:hypothetical protein
MKIDDLELNREPLTILPGIITGIVLSAIFIFAMMYLNNIYTLEDGHIFISRDGRIEHSSTCPKCGVRSN